MDKKIKNYIKNLSEPKAFKKVMYGVGILFIALFIFQAGVFVGFHRSVFRHDWDDNFSKNFGTRSHMGMMNFIPENSPNAHGAIGKIVKVELPTIIVADKDNIEKVILINDDTQIRQMRDILNKTDLTIDKFVVVIGSPNAQGQIEAKLIRIIPSSMYSTEFTSPKLPTENITIPKN